MRVLTGALWGRIPSCRPIFNRPKSAGPGKVLCFTHQAGADGVFFNVSGNTVRLDLISHQSVIAFVLPECPARRGENLVGLAGSETLQRLRDFGQVGQRSEQ